MVHILRFESLQIEVNQRYTGIENRFTASMCKGFIPCCGCILIAALVDYRKRFIDVEVGWPGSVGDGRVFNNSRLSNCLDAWLEDFPKGFVSTGEADGIIIEEEIPAFIFADSAYGNSKHLVTTFKVNECSDFVVAVLNKKL